MRDKGIIKEFFEEDGMSYDDAICDPMYASVINENGFVAVCIMLIRGKWLVGKMPTLIDWIC